MNTTKQVSFPTSIIKICKDCKEEKECSWKSSVTSKGTPVYKARCKECDNKYKRNKYKKNQKEIRNRRNLLDRKKKTHCVNLLGGKCSICGYDKSINALSFHHKDKKTKEYNISTLLKSSLSNPLIKKELKKCILLCMNCHMELHGQEVE